MTLLASGQTLFREDAPFFRRVGPFLLVPGLFLYNAMWAMLTWQVGLLRDAEEHSHYSPPLKDYFWLYRLLRQDLALGYGGMASRPLIRALRVKLYVEVFIRRGEALQENIEVFPLRLANGALQQELLLPARHVLRTPGLSLSMSWHVG